MTKVDQLFLSKDCPDCAFVRAELDMNAVIKDDFRGTKGQQLHVYSALSDEAARYLLDNFGHNGDKDFTPMLVPHEGKALHKPKNIIRYLRENGMAVDRD